MSFQCTCLLKLQKKKTEKMKLFLFLQILEADGSKKSIFASLGSISSF